MPERRPQRCSTGSPGCETFRWKAPNSLRKSSTGPSRACTSRCASSRSRRRLRGYASLQSQVHPHGRQCAHRGNGTLNPLQASAWLFESARCNGRCSFRQRGHLPRLACSPISSVPALARLRHEGPVLSRLEPRSGAQGSARNAARRVTRASAALRAGIVAGANKARLPDGRRYSAGASPLAGAA